MSNINHAESVIQKLRTSDKLPFTDVLSSQSINEKLTDIPYRERVFSPDLTVYGLLSQALSADQSCQAAVTQIIAHLVSQGKDAPSANTSAYSQARSRLPEKVLSSLAKESAIDLERQAKPEWLWRNRHVKMPDGTTVSMPDTSENQKMYPQPASQKEGVGFPIARLVGIFSLSTGALLDLAMAPWSGKKTGEHALLRQLMHVFESGDIVLADAYYASFFLIAMLMKIGVDVVFPMHASRGHDFRKGRRLGKKDHIVQWRKPAKPEWMDKQMYYDFPEIINIRETTVVDARPGYKTKSRILVTTFLNEKEVTAQDLGVLYGYRWFAELNLRSVKEVMQMGILRGKTPDMVHKEIWAHVLAYNLVRKIMVQAAVVHSSNPRQMSFKLALQMTLSFRQTGKLTEDSEIYACLLRIIVYKKVGNRSGRSEPRMVKRRPKAFPRLQKPRNFYQNQAA
jgi:DDE family transposase